MCELKKAIWNWKTACSILCIFTILISPLIMVNPWRQMEEMDCLYWLTFPMATSGFTPFACIFPIIPYGLEFIEEYNSGCVKALLPRAGRKRYIRNKIISCGLSGGFVMVMSFAAIFAICMIGGSPVTEGSVSEFYIGTVWEPYVLVMGGKLVLLMKLLLAFAYGVVWALTALLISCFCTNRYAALMIPFVFHQITWHLFQGKPYNPVYLLRGDWAGYSSWYEPLLIQGTVIALIIIVIALKLRRKLYDV